MLYGPVPAFFKLIPIWFLDQYHRFLADAALLLYQRVLCGMSRSIIGHAYASIALASPAPVKLVHCPWIQNTHGEFKVWYQFPHSVRTQTFSVKHLVDVTLWCSTCHSIALE